MTLSRTVSRAFLEERFHQSDEDRRNNIFLAKKEHAQNFKYAQGENRVR
jgi:hypothetical protein